MRKIESVSGFASVTDGQYDDLFPIIMIQGHIGPAAEWNHPLAKIKRHLFGRAADFGMPGEQLYTVPDCPNGALGGIAALGSKEVVESGHIVQGGFRPF